MALRKPTPAFEGQESAAASDAPVLNVDPLFQEQIVGADLTAANETPIRPTPVPTPAAAVPVVAAKTAVAVAKKYAPALQEFKNVIDPSSLDFDTFPRVTVGLDGFSDDQKVPLGKVIRVQLMSWNERFTISPGVKNSEADELVRFSLDGKTIDGTGEDVNAYLAKLRDVDGYTEASLKKYYAIYGFLMQTSAPDAKGYPVIKDVAPEDRSIVSVQIPPRSVSQFTRFQLESGIKISQGIIEASDCLTLTQGKQSGKTTDYANVAFSSK